MLPACARNAALKLINRQDMASARIRASAAPGPYNERVIRPTIPRICTLIAGGVTLVGISSCLTTPSLCIPLTSKTWLALHCYEGLARVMWFHSDRDDIEVNRPKGTPHLRVARRNPPAIALTSNSDGGPFWGYDPSSGFWAHNVRFGRLGSVPMFGFTRRESLPDPAGWMFKPGSVPPQRSYS